MFTLMEPVPFALSDAGVADFPEGLPLWLPLDGAGTGACLSTPAPLAGVKK